MALAPALPRAASAAVPVRAGWTLRFADDFAGPAGGRPSPARWRIDTGHGYPGGPPNWGTQEVERYTGDRANLALDGRGHLRIVPRRDAKGEWTSGRIETIADDFKAPAGGVLRIEARIAMPGVHGAAALGYWPAFWALGQSYRRLGRWPAAGEFDIMENVNGLDSVWGILHCGVNPGGSCGEPYGIGASRACPGRPCAGHFHVYAFEWDRSASPGQFRWYVDGKLFNQVLESQVSPDIWDGLAAQAGYFVLVDVAMGGGFSYAMAGGKPTPTPATEPGHAMLVDYVAIWTRGGRVPPAGAKGYPQPPRRARP